MLRALDTVVDSFVLTNAPTAPASRAWDIENVTEFVTRAKLPAEIVPAFDAALERVGGGINGTVVVTGSFHTVGDAMARLQVSPFAS